MNSFNEQESICTDCGYSGFHEIEFEQVRPNHDNIIKICPLCGAANVVGQRVEGEEFYY